MNPELNLTYDEKMKIMKWKNSLSDNNSRKFIYAFVENGNLSDDGYKLYNYVIKTDDKLMLVVSEDVKL